MARKNGHNLNGSGGKRPGTNGTGKGSNPASLKAIEAHRFQPGWSGGPGNPLARQVNQLRSALVNAVTVADIQAIARQLIDQAKAGDVAAAKEVFDRTVGKATQPIDLGDGKGGYCLLPIRLDGDRDLS